MRNPTSDLIELRHYYENLVAQSESQATQAKAQIEHIDALLVNTLIQSQGQITLRADIVENVPAALSAAQTQATETTQSIPNVPPAKAKTTKAKPEERASSRSRESFPLLPQYKGMTKLESIGQILSEQSGYALHQDAITQLLYGDLSAEVLKVESRRMRASLFQGVTKGLWQRAVRQPSCYIIQSDDGYKSPASSERSILSKTRIHPVASTKLGRKPKASSIEPRAVKENALVKPATRGRTQVLSLPAQYAGLSKIDAVAKVLEEDLGTVMHMDEIIRHLYGKLTDNELKLEKVRMKDVMTRGVQRKLWQKAKGVPSSIVMGESNQSNQPTATKEKKSSKVTVLQPKVKTVKKPRKATSAAQTEKPKRKRAEVMALLRNANIKI
jgi:hypothetical protein